MSTDEHLFGAYQADGVPPSWLADDPTDHHAQERRDVSIGHALAALGDSALSHDGRLRPRVWELADQIAAYIRDGSTS